MIITKYGDDHPVGTILRYVIRRGPSTWWTQRTPTGWIIRGRERTTSGRPIPPLTWQQLATWMDKHGVNPNDVTADTDTHDMQWTSPPPRRHPPNTITDRGYYGLDRTGATW